jgi:hypothetical protein
MPSPVAIQPPLPVTDAVQEQPIVVTPPAEIERFPTPLPDFHVDDLKEFLDDFSAENDNPDSVSMYVLNTERGPLCLRDAN